MNVYVQTKLNRKQNSLETLRKSDVVPTLNIQQIEQSSLKLPSQRPNEDQTSTKLTSLTKKRTNSWKEKQIYKKKKKIGWEADNKRQWREREIIVNRVSDTRRNTLDITRRGRMTMFSASEGEFLSARQVNSGFANSLTTDGYAARGNDSATS